MTVCGRTLGALGLLAAITFSAPAQADNTAGALFHEGRALLDKNKLEEACDRFKKSLELEPAVGTAFSLGECYERRGMLASAWAAFLDAASLAAAKQDPREADARKQAAQIEPDLSRLHLVVAAPAPGQSVTRDGLSLGTIGAETTLPADAGRHRIVATAPNRKRWETTIDLRKGTTATVSIPALEPAAPAPPPPPADRPASEPSDSRRTIAIGLEIGGGVLLGTGLVFGGIALAGWSSVTADCPEATCPTEAERARRAGDVDSARTMAVISTVGVVGGAIALAAGIVLHVTAPSARGASRRPAYDGVFRF